MGEEFERYAMLLHSAASLWRARLDARLRPWGMTQTTWRTLWLLRAADTCYNQSELAARLGIETPTLVGILDRMESKGWLRRVPDEQDRRQKRIEITGAGRDAAREIEGEVLAVRAEMLTGFDAQELQAGARILECVVERAGAHKA